MSLLIVARLTFLEASRRRVLWVTACLSVAFVAFFALSFNAMQRNFEAGSQFLPAAAMGWGPRTQNLLTMTGLYAVNLLALLLTGLTAADSLAGDVASGAIQSVLAKPIRRWQVVLGKWLGHASLMTAYVLLMSGGILGSIFLLSGYVPPQVPRGLALLCLNCLLFLSLSFAGGARLSTLANGALLFGLFGLAVLGSWMEQIGSVLGDSASVQWGTLVSLLLPSEAIWHRAAFEMRPSLASTLSFSPMMPVTSFPTPAMVWYALLYTLAALALSLRWFARRDV